MLVNVRFVPTACHSELDSESNDYSVTNSFVLVAPRTKSPPFVPTKGGEKLVTLQSRGKSLTLSPRVAAKLAPTQNVGLKHSRYAEALALNFSGD